MNWYTYSQGGRFTIIVAERLICGRLYQYKYAVARDEIPFYDLPYIIHKITKKFDSELAHHGIA
jgi:hypothetical protein